MDLKDTIMILKLHNVWRRGANIKMLDPKDIGIALDNAIRFLEKLDKANEQKAKKKQATT